MIHAAEGVPPGRRVAERLVLDDRRVFEQLLLAALALQTVVRARPDALEVGHLALAVARAAAGAVALVLGALRLGAEERDVGQRAVAAVLALEHRAFRRELEHAQRPRTLRRVLRALVRRLAEPEERRVRREHAVVHPAAELVAE